MTSTLTCAEIDIELEAVQTFVCTASEFWLQPFVTPLILALSACVAIFGVVSARIIARRKATLDLIEKVESTPHYRKLRATFSRRRKSNTLTSLHNPKSTSQKNDRKDVQDFLNHYEIVAIGIQKGTLDKDIYVLWMGAPFVRDWNASADYIQRERWRKSENTPDKLYYHFPLYDSFGRVAKLFDPNAKVIDITSGEEPDNPSGPGDEPLPELDEAALKKREKLLQPRRFL